LVESARNWLAGCSTEDVEMVGVIRPA